MSTPPDPCKCCKPRYIKFRLKEILTSSSEFADSEVELYWDGIPPDDAANPWEVDVYNLEMGAGVYVFSASEGDVGYAVWDDVEDKYRIFYVPKEFVPTYTPRCTVSGSRATDTAVAPVLAFFDGDDPPFEPLSDLGDVPPTNKGFKVNEDGTYLIGFTAVPVIDSSSGNNVNLNVNLDGTGTVNLCSNIDILAGTVTLTKNDTEPQTGVGGISPPVPFFGMQICNAQPHAAAAFTGIVELAVDDKIRIWQKANPNLSAGCHCWLAQQCGSGERSAIGVITSNPRSLTRFPDAQRMYVPTAFRAAGQGEQWHAKSVPMFALRGVAMKPIPHRKRVRHFHDAGHCRELTFSCYRRMPLLTNDVWRSMLSESIRRACLNHGYSLVAFVYMPEHVHLIVFPGSGSPGVDALLRAIKRPFSYRIKQLLLAANSPLVERLAIRQRPGITTFRFWQEGPGYDRNLTTSRTIETAIDYVHENPVRRGLCQRATDWRWSSARRFHEPTTDDDDALPPIQKLPAHFL